MIHTAFTLMVFSVLFLIVGLIKPQWVLFGSKNPQRFWVINISVVLFMICATLYGEGNRRLQEEQQAATRQAPVEQKLPAK